MRLRVISPTVHGIIDYVAAVALIAGPYLFGLGASSPIAFWLSIVTGVAVLVVSTNTIYRYGVFRNIPFDGHLAIDWVAATVFIAVPLAFSFEGIDFFYYIANGVLVYTVVVLSDNCEGTQESTKKIIL